MQSFFQKDIQTTLWLFAILLLGTFLRFYHLGELSFNADEFLDINATMGYAQTGEWQAWDFNFQQPSTRINEASDERAWIYRWQVAQLFHFFAPTEFVARSVSALWGVLSIAILFFVTLQSTRNKVIALLAAFFFAISPTAIEMDRTLRMYAMFAPIFLLFSWSLFRFLEPSGKSLTMPCLLGKPFRCNFDARFLVPTMLLGLLSFHLHMLTGNIVFVILVYCVINAIRSWRKGEGWRNKYIFILLMSAIALLATKLFVPKIWTSFMAGIVFWEDHWSYVGKALLDYSHPLLFIALFVLGAFFLIRDKKEKESMWLFSSFLTLLFAAIFLWHRNVGTQYFFFAHAFSMMLIASGIFFVAKIFSEKFSEYQKSFMFAIVFLLALVPNYGYFFLENNAYRATSASESPNYRKVFAYFKKHKQSGDALITRDFRSYYFYDAKVPVYDFGGELSKEKFSLNDLATIMKKHEHGWFIYSDNDEEFIDNQVETYIAEHFEKINDIQLRGRISVYRW